MFAPRLLIAASLACLQSSLAMAGDVVTLRCDFPEQGKISEHYTTIIADAKGISLTNYSTNKESNKLEYTKVYTENKKEENKEEYYRINSAEIAWGSNYSIYSTTIKLDSSIDLRTGVAKDDVVITGKNGITERPTNIGHCKPD